MYEFMSDIKKVDLGGGGGRAYIYIYVCKNGGCSITWRVFIVSGIVAEMIFKSEKKCDSQALNPRKLTFEPRKKPGLTFH